MSQSVRQSNLFAGEDYRKVYKSFKDINFKSYDYDTIKQSLVDYIKNQYPEDFNDYVESSEFIAIIELLAYLGMLISFRVDLNSRENFLDTAERKESIIRLARMVSYQPKRNIAAKGMFKLTGVQTSEHVSDSLGNDLAGLRIVWNDPNNINSYEQFITILNASFSNTNLFGYPYKSEIVEDISTDLYQMNSLKGYEVAYNVGVHVNGIQLPFDIVNPDIGDNQVFERNPDPSNPFYLMYRNDGNGSGSKNTGFFLHFIQGKLDYEDSLFDFPVENRVYDIEKTGINNENVYVQEIDESGNVVDEWTKVQNTNAGTNVVYNSINVGNRSIYSERSGNEDKVSIIFPDGKFGDVPTGTFRFWTRSSIGQTFTMRPDDVNNKSIVIPYTGADGQQYNLTLVFSLEETINNSAPAELDEDVKQNAPQVYYTQNRMVNNEDYNVFPLTRGNEILKVQTINRTYAGHSRYIDINDPTGTHQDVMVTADDGALYRDYEPQLEQVQYRDSKNQELRIVKSTLSDFVGNINLRNFFYDIYLKEYRVVIDRYFNRDPFSVENGAVFWKTIPTSNKNNTGYFVNAEGIPVYANEISYGSIVNEIDMPIALDQGSVIEFVDTDSIQGSVYGYDINKKVQTVVKSVRGDNGVPDLTNPLAKGPITLDKEINDGAMAVFHYPGMRTTFNSDEIDLITNELIKGKDLGLGYNVEGNGGTGAWYTLSPRVVTTDIKVLSTSTDIDVKNFDLDVYFDPNSNSKQILDPSVNSLGDNSWLILMDNITSDTDSVTSYDFISRGTRYIFESLKDIRFYNKQESNFSSSTSRARKDEIIVMGTNQEPNFTDVWQYIIDDNGSHIWKNFTTGETMQVGGKFEVCYVSEEIIRAFLIYEINGSYNKHLIVTDANQLSKDNCVVINNLSELYADLGITNPDEEVINITIMLDSDNALGDDKVFNIYDTIMYEDGYSDPRKIEVIPADSNYDGVPDNLFVFDEVVSINSAVFFEKITDLDGYEYYQPWTTSWLDWRSDDLLDKDPALCAADINATGLLLLNKEQRDYFEGVFLYELYNQVNINDYPNIADTVVFTQDDTLSPYITALLTYDSSRFFTISEGTESDKNVDLVEDPDGERYYCEGSQCTTEELEETKFILINNSTHSVKNGKSFTLNTNATEQNSFDFKWVHYADVDRRIDPSVSNIMDMILLTNGYYQDVMLWKSTNDLSKVLPIEPTVQELKTQFSDFDNIKMMSDMIVYKSGKFKALFGQQAEEELQATFKIVKSVNSKYTDNEVKSNVISKVDEYFDINNWDFGETFYFTELAGYIHQELSDMISSVVIVSKKQESEFGNLFQIKSESNELFISTATVSDVEIIVNLTETNMRM